jgi:hypothetical protein
MKDKKKYHWLKVDFNKWKDEDESDDEVGQPEDLEEVRFPLEQVLWYTLKMKYSSLCTVPNLFSEWSD